MIAQMDEGAVAGGYATEHPSRDVVRGPGEVSPPADSSVEAAAEYLAKVARLEVTWQQKSLRTKIQGVIAACNAGTVTPMKALSTIEELLE